MRLKYLARTPLVAALVSTTILSGCVTTQQYNQAQFADGARDECHIFRQPMISAKEKVERNTAGAALATGILTAIIVKASGGSNAQAAGAGVAGAVVGGFFGHQLSQGDTSAESKKLLAELQGQADAASGAPGTISRMTECRRNQVAQVKKATDAGLLSKAVARTKLLEIQKQTQLDNKLVGEFVNKARGGVDEYVKLAAEENISEEQLLGQYNDESRPWLQSSQPAASSMSTVPLRVVANGARIRASANTSSAVLGSVSSGHMVNVVAGEDQGGWKKIIYKGRPAYVHGSLLEGGSSLATPQTQTVSRPTYTNKNVQVEGENEQQIAVRELSRSTIEAEAEQKELQEVDSEIGTLLAALNA